MVDDPTLFETRQHAEVPGSIAHQALGTERQDMGDHPVLAHVQRSMPKRDPRIGEQRTCPPLGAQRIEQEARVAPGPGTDGMGLWVRDDPHREVPGRLKSLGADRLVDALHHAPPEQGGSGANSARRHDLAGRGIELDHLPLGQTLEDLRGNGRRIDLPRLRDRHAFEGGRSEYGHGCPRLGLCLVGRLTSEYPSTLMNDVRNLVRQQPLATLRRRLVLVRAEHDVVAHRERTRVDGLRRVGRLGALMHPDG